MKTVFSKEYMQLHNGCYGWNKTKEIFFKNENDTITIDDILQANIPLAHKYWFVCKKTELTKQINRQIAIDLSEILLPIYEKRYSEKEMIRFHEAMEAAKLFMDGRISFEEMLEKRGIDIKEGYFEPPDAYTDAYTAIRDAVNDVNITNQIEQYLINLVKKHTQVN